MSKAEKTGNKLIDSIRKTKKEPATAAVKSATKAKTSKKIAKPKKVSTKSKAKPAKAAPMKAKVVKPKVSKSKAPKSKISKTTAPAIMSITPTEDGSRVWPD